MPPARQWYNYFMKEGGKNNNGLLPIEQLEAELLWVFRDAGYREKSLKLKKEMWNAIVRRHIAKGYVHYEQSVIDEYINTARWRRDVAHQKENYTRQMIRNAHYMQEFHETGNVVLANKKRLRNGKPSSNEQLLTVIESHPSWNPKYKGTVKRYGRSFLDWLEENGISSVEDITGETVLRFFNEKKFSPSSVHSYKYGLRKVFLYLYETGAIRKDISDVFVSGFEPGLIEYGTPGRNRKKDMVSDGASAKAEIDRVLKSIDRTGLRGKRDYAILLLGAELGLKAAEIVNLMLENHDPERGIIMVRNALNGKYTERRLSRRLSDAIRDYIHNARPECDVPYIFLPLRSPLARLSPTNCTNIYSYYRKALSLPAESFSCVRGYGKMKD